MKPKVIIGNEETDKKVDELIDLIVKYVWNL